MRRLRRRSARRFWRAKGSDYELAKQFRVTRETIRRWRKRDFVEDASHTPHHLPTTLNAGQEELVIYLRTQLRLPLDDLLAVIREFIEPSMTRSALGRLLRRRGHSRLPQPEKPANPTQPFKVYLPGYFHVDLKYLPQMADETSRRYVFVAKDPSHPLGLLGGQACKDPSGRPQLSPGAGQGGTRENPNHPHR
ncbi:protein of unknown function [Methylacidimicrobium sp. AP8]|nr:protein of unknown function [Methylacidimicrobium sp. AP8]